MKTSTSVFNSRFRKLAVSLAGFAFVLGASAASYEWTFNSGDLSTGLGNGTMVYGDAESASLTTFGTTGGGVPNIGGNAAQYIHVPAFANLANGYLLSFDDTAANGGGLYVNNYTVIFDVLVPSPWPVAYIVPFFNTDPANGNDGDFYLYGDGEIGIGSGGYSSPGTLVPDTWYRVAFVNNGTSLSYYVNGNLVGSQGTGVSIDGTWSLYTKDYPGPDLLLFNEGDGSGQYTHELYLNSIAFIDEAMTGPDLLTLGGPNAEGIFAVPEPSTTCLMLLGFLAVWVMTLRVRFGK